MTYEKVELSRSAALSIVNGTSAAIPWDLLNAETSAFVPNPLTTPTDTITIPTGKAGVYAGFLDLITSGTNFLNCEVRLVIDGLNLDLASGPANFNPGSRWLLAIPAVELGVGSAVKVVIVNEHGSTQSYTGRIQLYRLVS